MSIPARCHRLHSQPISVFAIKEKCEWFSVEPKFAHLELERGKLSPAQTQRNRAKEKRKNRVPKNVLGTPRETRFYRLAKPIFSCQFQCFHTSPLSFRGNSTGYCKGTRDRYSIKGYTRAICIDSWPYINHKMPAMFLQLKNSFSNFFVFTRSILRGLLPHIPKPCAITFR